MATNHDAKSGIKKGGGADELYEDTWVAKC